MWCIETIRLLNQKAEEFSRKSKPIAEARKALGIKSEMTKHDIKPRPVKVVA
jgi:hypothetical protein